MLGMVGNRVESVKLIGRREMNMDIKMKTLFYEIDSRRHRPYFNDAKELFGIWFLIHFSETANKQKQVGLGDIKYF